MNNVKLSNVTNDMAVEIYEAAVYGGINYWCHFIDHDGKKLVDGGIKFLNVSDANENDWDIYNHALTDYRPRYINPNYFEFPLNLAMIKFGIADAASFEGISVDDWFEDYDASSADTAIQFALFGKVIFG